MSVTSIPPSGTSLANDGSSQIHGLIQFNMRTTQRSKKTMKSTYSLVTLASALALFSACSKSADNSPQGESDISALDPTRSAAPVIVDDFSDPTKNSLGIGRQFLDDRSTGGSTQTAQTITDGVLSVKGELAPPRGQPAWASAVLLLHPEGLPQDVSTHEGVRLLLRVNQGDLSISVNSSEITNFDYHATSIARQSDGEFHEVKIPFSQLKRAWSAQTPLNTKTITSVSLVAFGLQKGSFDFEFDEVSFY